MDTSTIITSIGLAIIFIYGLTVILNFYGVNIEIYGPYISFYTFLLNFVGKPNIQYNASKNTLMVTMEQKDLKQKTTNNLLDFDEEGNWILFIQSGILLQKLNNIIINYSLNV